MSSQKWLKITGLLLAAGCVALASRSQVKSPSGREIGTASDDMATAIVQGRAVFIRATRHAGGIERIRAIRSVRFGTEGLFDNAMQAVDPPGSVDAGRRPFLLTLNHTLDFDGARFRQAARRFETIGGYNVPIVNIARNGRRLTVYEAISSYTDLPGGGDDLVPFAQAFFPPLILKRAMSHPSAITHLGSAADGAWDDISVQTDPGALTRLRVSRTGAILEIEYVVPDALAGALSSVVQYSDEAEISGVRWPRTSVHRRRGRVAFHHRLTTAEVNPTLDDGLFEPGAGLRRIERGPEPSIHEVAPGVFDIGDISGSTYRTPLVEFPSFLVVFDAPLNRATTQRVLAVVRARFGAKPVRYLVISHFHEDHSGGLRSYVEAGARVLAAPEHIETLRQIALAPLPFSTAFPPEAAESVIEPIPTERTISEGVQSIRVFRFPEVPHVRAMLAAEVQPSGVVLNADLFSPGVEWNPTFEAFLSWWSPRSQSIRLSIGVHHQAVSLEEVRAARASDLARRAAQR